MRILLSNDDGCMAPGLVCLAAELRTRHQVDVIAPDRNRSGASNSLTILNPLRVQRHADGTHCVDGTPTDCVHLALTGFLTRTPDMVVSGINAGANLGDDTLYSGTVAAAMEGRFLGLPTLAVSLCTSETSGHHYATGARVARTVRRRRLVQEREDVRHLFLVELRRLHAAHAAPHDRRMVPHDGGEPSHGRSAWMDRAQVGPYVPSSAVDTVARGAALFAEKQRRALFGNPHHV